MPAKIRKPTEPSPETRVMYSEEFFHRTIVEAQRLLAMDEYDIEIIVKPKVRNEGHTETHTGHLTATITMRQDALPGQAAYNCWHEVLHVFTRSLKDLVEDRLIGKYIPEELQTRAMSEWQDVEENTVERLAHAFVRLQGGEKNVPVSETGS